MPVSVPTQPFGWSTWLVEQEFNTHRDDSQREFDFCQAQTTRMTKIKTQPGADIPNNGVNEH